LANTTVATTAGVGDDITFTYTVTNQGTLDAYDVAIVDYMGTGLTFDPADATNQTNGWSLVAGNPVTTIPGPIAPGETATVDIDRRHRVTGRCRFPRNRSY